MPSKLNPPFWSAVALGTMAGMRATAAPIAINELLNRYPNNLHSPYFNWLASKKTGILFKIMGMGELIGDKLPGTPARIGPVGLIARCLSGGLAGGAIYEAAGYNALLGAFIGSAATSCSTFACYFGRKKTGAATGISDPFIGGAEDLLAIGTGIALISAPRT